jgi:hypothetical protein
MNPAGPKLRDIHPAPPPSWWPPAYGWWVVAALVVLLLIGLVLLARRARRRRRRWRPLEQAWEALRANHREGGDDPRLAAEVSQMLRRAARLHDPGAASLHGPAWHEFIREHAPEGTDATVLCSLEQVMYRPQGSLDSEAVLNAARNWMQHAVEEGRHV